MVLIKEYRICMPLSVEEVFKMIFREQPLTAYYLPILTSHVTYFENRLSKSLFDF